MLNISVQDRNDIKALLAKAGSDNPSEAAVAQHQFAKAVETPLRKVLLSGDIISNVFTPEDYSANNRIEYQLDLINPGDEANFYAYVIPEHGAMPHAMVESDYLMVPTYRIGNSISSTLRYIEDANWPVIQRMMEIMEAGFIKKMNDDGWQTILLAGADRNVVINDANASVGQFTPTLITNLKSYMRRNGGGNSSTLNQSKVTHIFASLEALDDIRSWDLSIIPDDVRSKIYYSPDNGSELLQILGVSLVGLYELGEGQEYQNYFTSTIGGSMAATDVEIAIAIDKSRTDAFVNPVRRPLQIFEDNTIHRQGLFGLYGWTELGFAVLDSRRVLIASL